jgi:predicted transcriptional regulator
MRENKAEAAMTGIKTPLSDELQKQIEQVAREQNRKPSEVLEDAVRKYLDDQKWQSLVARGEQRARDKGLTEADVPRLIEEVRRENRERGR